MENNIVIAAYGCYYLEVVSYLNNGRIGAFSLHPASK